MKNWIKQAVLYIMMAILSTLGGLIAQNISKRVERAEQKIEILIQEKR